MLFQDTYGTESTLLERAFTKVEVMMFQILQVSIWNSRNDDVINWSLKDTSGYPERRIL